MSAPALPPAVAAALERIPSDEAARATERIGTLQRACGCDTGAAFMVAGAALFAALWLLDAPPLPAEGVRRGGWGVAFVFAAAGVGKAAGLLLARVRLRRVYARLERRAAAGG